MACEKVYFHKKNLGRLGAEGRGLGGPMAAVLCLAINKNKQKKIKDKIKRNGMQILEGENQI